MNKLQIPNKVETLLVLQSFVVESARVYKLPQDLLDHLKLVSEEAFLHILKNAFASGELSEITITTDIDNFHFKLSFFDKGLPFDSSSTKEYQPSEDVDLLDTEGIDLFIIKQYVNHVQWINHGSQGKEFRLLIELPNKDIVELLENREEPVASKFVPKMEDVETRPFKESDAIKIAQTIYRAYGYTYPNEDLYYPERITKLNESGELISMVCYDTKRNELVGHYALEKDSNSAIAESGQAVVVPEYRGFNLMEKMRNKLEAYAKELQLEGILSQPVTTHIYSQKANVRFNSLPCGFSFGLVPKRLSFRQIHQSLSQRESCLTYFKLFKKRKRKAFLPEKHKEFIQQTYKDMGIDFIEQFSETINSEENGAVKSVYSSSWGFGVITISHLGAANISEIKQAIHNLLFTIKSEVIFLYLPIEDGDVSDLVDFVESEKFFFSGLVPSYLKGKDAIRFEYLNGTIDISKINIFEEKAKEIFHYVLNAKEKVLQ